MFKNTNTYFQCRLYYNNWLWIFCECFIFFCCFILLFHLHIVYIHISFYITTISCILFSCWCTFCCDSFWITWCTWRALNSLIIVWLVFIFLYNTNPPVRTIIVIIKIAIIKIVFPFSFENFLFSLFFVFILIFKH